MTECYLPFKNQGVRVLVQWSGCLTCTGQPQHPIWSTEYHPGVLPKCRAKSKCWIPLNVGQKQNKTNKNLPIVLENVFCMKEAWLQSLAPYGPPKHFCEAILKQRAGGTPEWGSGTHSLILFTGVIFAEMTEQMSCWSKSFFHLSKLKIILRKNKTMQLEAGEIEQR